MKSIPGYPEHFANEDGEIFRLKKGQYKKIKIRNYPDKRPILKIRYSGKSITKSISRLIALAFIPNPNNYPCILHKDDNPHNNRCINLFWGTHKMNMQDMFNKGRNICNQKFSKQDYVEIIKLRDSGLSFVDIAKKFNASRRYMCRMYHKFKSHGI